MSTEKAAVPILDLKAQYEQVGADIERLVLEVLRSGHYILGKFGVQLEQEVARICGSQFGVGCANGTDALILALWAADVGPGDEVICPPFTFAATAEAVAVRGAKPVFVDVDPVTFNLDPTKIEAKITSKTKAIIPVHLYGQPAEMDAICSIAARHKLTVIEDNAQAIGATYKDRPAGSFGHMTCISFYPTKNLGACGDAGMVVTSDTKLAERLRRLRAHGMEKRYYHDELGVNSRLDEIQAASLVAKVPHLPAWNEKRAQVAQWYTRQLSGAAGIVAPKVMPDRTHVWHQYTVRLTGADRQEVVAELSARGIASMIYYPVPLHLQPSFAGLGYKKGDFPVSERISDECLSLPMYPELSEKQVQQVVKALTEIVADKLALAPVSMPVVAPL